MERTIMSGRYDLNQILFLKKSVHWGFWAMGEI